jgi:hypothetical protein
MNRTRREPNLVFQFPSGDQWKKVGEVIYRKKVGTQRWKSINPSVIKKDHGVHPDDAQRRSVAFPFDFLCKILKHYDGINVFGRHLQHKDRYIRIMKQVPVEGHGDIRVWWKNYAIEIPGRSPLKELKRIEDTCRLLRGGFKFGRLVSTRFKPAVRPKRRARMKKASELRKRARSGSQPAPNPETREKTG